MFIEKTKEFIGLVTPKFLLEFNKSKMKEKNLLDELQIAKFYYSYFNFIGLKKKAKNIRDVYFTYRS
jgi:hypothetical protein